MRKIGDAYTPTLVIWDNSFFETLFAYDWDLQNPDELADAFARAWLKLMHAHRGTDAEHDGKDSGKGISYPWVNVSAAHVVKPVGRF